jgi:hypothetical protein
MCGQILEPGAFILPSLSEPPLLRAQPLLLKNYLLTFNREIIVEYMNGV